MAAAAAGSTTSQRFFQSFSDALIDKDPQAALEELTKALEQNPDDAQYYCQRAYCHILLGKYRDGIADVKKSLELNPNNPTAFLRKGMCEYHKKDYASVNLNRFFITLVKDYKNHVAAYIMMSSAKMEESHLVTV